LFAAAKSSRLTWIDRQPMPTPVAGGYTVAIGENVIYAGGAMWRDGVKHWLRDVNKYNVTTDSWEAGPALPESLAYGAFTLLDGAVEIYGGSGGKTVSRKVWRLDHGTSWIPAGTLNFDFLLSRAVTLAGRVYIFGGCPGVVDLTDCSDAVRVREKDGSWRPVSQMPAGRVTTFATAVLGSRVYLFGGCSMASAGKLINRDDAYRFDIPSGKWQPLRPLPLANRGISAVTLDDRRILLSGGYTAPEDKAKAKPADFGFTGAVLIYDMEKDQYSQATPLPLTVAGMETVMAGWDIVGMGGEDRMRGRTSRVLLGRFH
jgi:N-acetylneuraminic acid mutarotase